MAAAATSAASAGAVRAGKAFVEISARDAGIQGTINKIRKSFLSLGTTFGKIGIGASALGSGVLAPFVLLSKQAIDSASAIKDVSERVGATTEEIQAMTYAVGLSGGGLEDVEKAMGKLAVRMGEGGKSGSVTDAMKSLANEIAALPDDNKRAALANDMLGKSYRKLMPYLKQGAKGIDELRARAERNGGIYSSDQIDQLDDAGDALYDISTIMQSVGSAFTVAFMGGSGGIVKFAENMASIGLNVRNFIKNNASLIQTVGLVAAGLVALGAALVAVGVPFIALAGIVSGVAALLSPAGLIIAGLAALSAGLVMAAQDSTSLGDSFDEAYGGIADALESGQIELAAEIAFAAISLEWGKVLNEMERAWRDFQEFIAGGGKSMNKGKAAGKLLGEKGMFQSLWEDFQISALGRNIATTGATPGMEAILNAEKEREKQIDAERKIRDADLEKDIEDRRDRLRMLRQRAGGFGGGGDWGDVGAVAAAVGAGIAKSISSVTGGAFAGSALNVGREATVADDIKKGRAAQEKLVKLFEKAPPLVWGD